MVSLRGGLAEACKVGRLCVTCSLAVCKNGGGRPGPFYHVNDVSVYLSDHGGNVVYEAKAGLGVIQSHPLYREKITDAGIFYTSRHLCSNNREM